MRKCDNCGAALDATEGTVTCKFCQAVNAAPAREVAVPVPVQVVQQVVQVVGDAATAQRLCPHCQKRLAAVRVLDVELAGCGGCGGIWIDNEGARRVLASPHEVFGDLATRAAKNRATQAPPRSATPRCPTCQVGLDRVKAHGLELDVCADHGTWFDAWELSRLVRALRGQPDLAIAEAARDGTVACSGCRKAIQKSAANITDMGPRCDACWRAEQDREFAASVAQQQSTAGGVALGGAVLLGVLGVMLAAGDRKS